MADSLYGLSPQQWYRLRQMLHAYERGELRGGVSQPQRQGYVWSVEFGKPNATIAGVTAFGATNVASGAVSLYMVGSTGNTTDSGYDVTAFNLSTVAVTTDQWVQLVYNERSGQYLIHGTLEGRKVKDLVMVVPGSSFAQASGSVTMRVSTEYGLGLSLYATTAFNAGNALGIFAGSTDKSFFAVPSSSTGGQLIQGQCT